MTAYLTILLAILPVDEAKLLARAAERYSLTAEETALLGTIRRVENGAAGIEMGVEIPRAKRYRSSPVRSLFLQGKYSAGTIRDHYDGDLRAWAARWCPVNQDVWYKNAKFFMAKLGYEK